MNSGRKRASRVVPRWSGRGIAGLAFVAGFCGEWVRFAVLKTFFGSAFFAPSIWSKSVVIPALCAGLIWSVPVVAVCVRTRRVWLPTIVAPCLVLGWLMAVCMHERWMYPGLGADEPKWFDNIAISAAILAVLGWMAYSALTWLWKTFLWKPLEQTSTDSLCWACGYDLVGLANTCPECGSKIGELPRFSPLACVWLDRLQRHSHWMAALVLVGIGLWTAWVYVYERVPLNRFIAKFSSGDNRVYAYLQPRESRVGSYAFQNGVARSINTSHSAVNMVLVYLPLPDDKTAPMQLRVCSLMPSPAVALGGTSPPIATFGFPDIRADFSAQQADWVIDHGIPQSLIDRMIRLYYDEKWTSIPPVMSTGRDVPIIDPGPYLSAEGWGPEWKRGQLPEK
jgi:hypothetical protein